MADPITLGAFAVGAVFLILWYSAASHRDQHHVTRELLNMSKSHKLATDDVTEIDRIVRALPEDVRPDQLAHRLGRDLHAFQQSESLAEQFLLQLRQRFSAKWDAQMLRRAAEVVHAETSFMEALLGHEVLRSTAKVQRDTKVLQAEIARLNAEHEHEKLRRAAGTHTRNLDREEELADLDHRSKILQKQLELANLESQVDKVKNPLPPREKASAAERSAQEFARLIEDANARINSLIEFYRFAGEIDQRSRQTGLKPGDHEYEHIMNLLEAIRQRLIQ